MASGQNPKQVDDWKDVDDWKEVEPTQSTSALGSIRQMLEPQTGEGTFSRTAKGVGRSLLGTVTAPFEIGKAALMPAQTPDEALTVPAGSPPGAMFAKRMIFDPAMGLYGQSAEAFKQGDVQMGTRKAIAGSVPLIGPYTDQLLTRIDEKGDWAGTLAEVATSIATGKILQFGGSKVAGMFDINPETGMVQALKGRMGKTKFREDVGKALPEIKATGVKVEDVTSLVDAIQNAKKKIWMEYSGKLQGAAGAQIDGNAIADAMTASIHPKTRLENPGLAKRIEATANKYRQTTAAQQKAAYLQQPTKPITVFEAENTLQQVNKELSQYYLKNRMDRRTATKDPEIAWKVAQADALREQLYSVLDNATGLGARLLKEKYGALLSVEAEALRRIPVAQRQMPRSLSEQVGTWAGLGRAGRGVVTGSLPDVLEGMGEFILSRQLKKMNQSDYLVEKAVANYGKPDMGTLYGTVRGGPMAAQMIPNQQYDYDPETKQLVPTGEDFIRKARENAKR